MKLLSLDQSSKTSGWAIYENENLVTYGHFTLSQEDIGERLVAFRKEVMRLINKYEIDEIAFEDIQLQSSVGNNVQTFKVLAEIIGIMLMLVTELGINYTIVPSVRWKSALNIKGKRRAEQKQNAQLYVLNTYGVNATQDESDAICIGSYIKMQKSGQF